MKMQEALEIIEGRPKGFRVSYEKVDNGFLICGYFPDKEEELISTEVEAWRLANSFASQTKFKYVNIYVVDEFYSPVKGYRDKMIKNR